MLLLNKKTIVFDIDETLLSPDKTLHCLNETLKEKANFDPYDGKFGGSFAINRSEISKIFKGILDNKDEIAFVTAGSIKREKIKNFCKYDYNVELPERFQHFNLTNDKTPVLHQIKGNRIPLDIVFVDNSMSHIIPAKKEGFRTIYADNNLSDKTNGTKYISELKQFIQERKHEIAQAQAQEIEKFTQKVAAKKIQKHVRSPEGKAEFLKAREARESREAREAREARENILLRIPENEKEGFKKNFEGKTLEELKSLDNFSGGIVNRFNESLAPETAQINESCQTAAKNYRAELTFHALNYKLDGVKDNFVAAAKKSEKEAISAFDNDIPVSKLKKVCANILSHVFTLGVANLINKAATGNYLFYKHSQETNNLRKTKEIGRELSSPTL